MLSASLALDELERVTAIRHDNEMVEAAVRHGLALTTEGLRALDRLRHDITRRGRLSALVEADPAEDRRFADDVRKLERIARRMRQRQQAEQQATQGTLAVAPKAADGTL